MPFLLSELLEEALHLEIRSPVQGPGFEQLSGENRDTTTSSLDKYVVKQKQTTTKKTNKNKNNKTPKVCLNNAIKDVFRKKGKLEPENSLKCEIN